MSSTYVLYGIFIFIFIPMAIVLVIKAVLRWRESDLPYIMITFRKPIHSTMVNHEGPCLPVWLNTNQVYNRLDSGVTGFFRNATEIFPCIYRLHGKTFHGIGRYDNDRIEIWTTRYLYGSMYSYPIIQLVDGEDVYHKNYPTPQPRLHRLADQGA